MKTPVEAGVFVFSGSFATQAVFLGGGDILTPMPLVLWRLQGGAVAAFVAAMIIGFLPTDSCGSLFLPRTAVVPGGPVHELCSGNPGYALPFWLFIAAGVAFAIAAYALHRLEARRRAGRSGTARI